MHEVEIQNKVHPRNIIMFCGLGILGLISGTLDFDVFRIPLTKMVFPDPVVYTSVVELNQTVFANTAVLNNTGTAFNFLALGLFVLAAVFIIGLTAGVMGKGD